MAPLPPDPYKILGVSKDAQTPEIRSSYRKLVLRCHPDKVQDPKLKEAKQNEFQLVQQAYELLSSDAERQKYDDKVRLEELRRQMKEKAHISSPRPSAKHSGEFDVRTPEMRSSGFKSSPSPSKVYTFSRYDEEYGRGTRVSETKSSSRSSKREPSFSDRQASKREAEKERERERRKDEDRERRKKEEEVIRRKVEKEALKAEQKRQTKLRDREIRKATEDKHRARYAKGPVEVIEDDVPSKSERKRSSRKHDDKGGRTSPRDDNPSRPPLSRNIYSSSAERSAVDGTLYFSTDRNNFDTASHYVQASLGRSYSFSSRVPPVPSPPPSGPHKAYVMDDTEAEEYVRRSAAPSRRGSGDGPRSSRERSAYRKSSAEVLEDEAPSMPSPAARHAVSSSRSPPMGSSPPRYDLPRTNSMPQQPSMSRPAPHIARAKTFAASDLTPRGRDRSRNQPQARLDSSESEDEHERERAERRYRSRRTASPEPAPHVQHYEVDPQRRTRRIPHPPVEFDSPHGHYMHGQPIHFAESRIPPVYRESTHQTMPSRGYPPNVKTSHFDSVRYSEYPPYNGASVRA
ncbi:hypothetical protein PWT90_03260 [Aphanocladium album]|nr:hypothetical protein PWT90_03260 [Aphanocladium album]